MRFIRTGLSKRESKLFFRHRIAEYLTPRHPSPFSLSNLIAYLFIVQISYGRVPLSEPNVADTIECYRSDDPFDRVKIFQLKMPSVITDKKLCDDVMRKIPAVVRKLKIEDDGPTEKLREVVAPVLKLYGREKAYDAIIFRHPTPILFSDTGVVPVISTGMFGRAESGNELLGYAAHEVAHEYFASYPILSKHLLKPVVESGKKEAIERKPSRTPAIVELQCDAFAAATLAHLGYNPLFFIEGMEDIGRDFPAYRVGFDPFNAVRRRTVEQVVPLKYLQSTPKTSNELKELKRLIETPGAEDDAVRPENTNR